jgi:hypothetical protein
MNKAITSHEVSQSAISSACCDGWRRRSWTDMGLLSVPSNGAAAPAPRLEAAARTARRNREWPPR